MESGEKQVTDVVNTDVINTVTVPWLRSGKGATPGDGGCIMQVIDWINRCEWTDSPPCVNPAFRSVAISLNDSLDDQGRQRLLSLAPRLMNTNPSEGNHTVSDESCDRTVTVRLAVFAARKVLHLFEKKFPGDDLPRLAIEAAEAWCDNPTDQNKILVGQAALEAAYSAGIAANKLHKSSSKDAFAFNSAYAAASAAVHAANSIYSEETANGAANAAYVAYSEISITFLEEMLDEYDRLTGRTDTVDLDFAELCKAMSQ